MSYCIVYTAANNKREWLVWRSNRPANNRYMWFSADELVFGKIDMPRVYKTRKGAELAIAKLIEQYEDKVWRVTTQTWETQARPTMRVCALADLRSVIRTPFGKTSFESILGAIK